MALRWAVQLQFFPKHIGKYRREVLLLYHPAAAANPAHQGQVRDRNGSTQSSRKLTPVAGANAASPVASIRWGKKPPHKCSAAAGALQGVRLTTAECQNRVGRALSRGSSSASCLQPGHPCFLVRVCCSCLVSRQRKQRWAAAYGWLLLLLPHPVLEAPLIGAQCHLFPCNGLLMKHNHVYGECCLSPTMRLNVGRGIPILPFSTAGKRFQSMLRHSPVTCVCHWHYSQLQSGRLMLIFFVQMRTGAICNPTEPLCRQSG